MKIDLNDKGYWEVAKASDIDMQFKGQNIMIDVMKEIYPTVREHFKLESYDLFNDSKHPTLHDTFEWFLDAVELAVKDLEGVEYNFEFIAEWVINTYHYTNTRINNSVFLMPLHFLYDLERTNKHYFKMLYSVFHLLRRVKSLWVHGDDGYDDYYEDEVINHLEECPEDDDRDHRSVLEQFDHLKEFTGKYGPRMHVKGWTLKTLKRKVAEAKPTCLAEKTIINWIRFSYPVFDSPGTMNDVCEAAENAYCSEQDIERDEHGGYDYHDSQPVLPGQVIRFTWIDNNYFDEWYIQWVNDHAGNFGSAEYYYKMECQSPTDLYDMDDRPGSLKEFIEHLVDFFQYGYDNMNMIRDYAKGDWKQKIFGINDEALRLPVEGDLEDLQTG